MISLKVKPINLFIGLVSFGIIFQGFGTLIPAFYNYFEISTVKGAGVLPSQILWVLLYGSAILLIYFKKNIVLSKSKINYLIILFLSILCIYVMLSTLWSFNPEVTLRRAIAFNLSVIAGLYFPVNYNLQQFVRVVSYSCLIILIASFLLILLVPSFAVHQTGTHEGLWRGLYHHKNSFGTFTALTVLFCLFFPKDKTKDWWISGLGVLGAGFGLYMAEARGAQLSLMVSLFSIPLLTLFYFPKKVSFYIGKTWLFCTILGGTLFYTYWHQFLALLDRSPRLSGRLTVWPLVIEEIKKRPFFGYGFSGFWTNYNLRERIYSQMTWTPASAYNGYIDLTIDLGIIGLLIFILIIILYLTKLNNFFPKRLNKLNKILSPRILPFVFLINFLVKHITARTIIQQNTQYLILFSAFLLFPCFGRNPRKLNV